MPADKSLSTETETRSDGTDNICINARFSFVLAVVLFYVRVQDCDVYFYTNLLSLLSFYLSFIRPVDISKSIFQKHFSEKCMTIEQ